jgi:hypothetical protein
VNKRPLSVTIIGWLFIIAGTVGFVYHASEFSSRPFRFYLVWVCLLRLIAITCGVFLLRGSNLARWVLLMWIGYHVVLSAFESLSGVVIHGLLLLVIAYFLFRRQVSPYFSTSVSRLND